MMAAERKPRKGNKGARQKKNQPKAPEAGPFSNTIFESLFDYVNPTTAAGVGVTVLALAASAVLLRSPKKQTKKLSTKGLKTGGNSLKYAKSAPLVGMPEREEHSSNKRVSLELVSKMFQQCLQSRQKEQRMMMEEFYNCIRSWNHAMLDTPAQTIVVNFLFWYFRMANSPKITFTSEQADYIRYWADYELSEELDWSIFNLKFDFMYSIALLQRSIPHMKQFWKFIVTTLPREQPNLEINSNTIGASQQSATRKKDNYTLTRYQAACILGKWDEVKRIGNKIKQQTKDIGFISQKDNYMLNYALRAMDMPQSNANFGQMHKIVDVLSSEFSTDLMPPARFGEWQVHSFKYKNRNVEATPTDDNKFVISSINMKDKEGWYHFYPPLSRNVSMSRIPREIKLWGRIAQMMSPMNGLSGCLPMTGTWSDLNLYMEMEWTYKASNPSYNRKKHGILKLEREPIEEKVISKDMFGRESIHYGYKWKGTLTVSVKDEEDKFASRLLSLGNLNNTNDNKARQDRIRDIFMKREENKNSIVSSINENDNNNNNELPPTSTTIKFDEKSEETNNETQKESKNENEESSNEEIAIYDIEVVIETDIKKDEPSNVIINNNNNTNNITRGGPSNIFKQKNNETTIGENDLKTTEPSEQNVNENENENENENDDPIAKLVQSLSKQNA